jgi:hypothetical protein
MGKTWEYEDWMGVHLCEKYGDLRGFEWETPYKWRFLWDNNWRPKFAYIPICWASMKSAYSATHPLNIVTENITRMQIWTTKDYSEDDRR